MSRSPLDKARTRLKTFGEARLLLLRDRRIGLTDIARALDVSTATVSRVNKGTRRSRKIEREIARRLKLTEAEAFPEWHRRDVQP